MPESSIHELLPHLATHDVDDEAIEMNCQPSSPTKAYCTTPLDAAQVIVRAQEDDQTFGCMSSVMARRPITMSQPIRSNPAATLARAATVGSFPSEPSLDTISQWSGFTSPSLAYGLRQPSLLR